MLVSQILFAWAHAWHARCRASRSAKRHGLAFAAARLLVLGSREDAPVTVIVSVRSGLARGVDFE